MTKLVSFKQLPQQRSQVVCGVPLQAAQNIAKKAADRNVVIAKVGERYNVYKLVA